MLSPCVVVMVRMMPAYSAVTIALNDDVDVDVDVGGDVSDADHGRNDNYADVDDDSNGDDADVEDDM